MKERIFEILTRKDEHDKAGFFFEAFILLLIALSIVAITLESFSDLSDKYGSLFDGFEAFTVIIFTIEYLLRLWTADLLFPDVKHPRLKFMISPAAVVDLLAILPFYLPFLSIDLRFLRMGRLLWVIRMLVIFKIGRYLEALTTLVQVIRESATQLLVSLLLCFFLMLFASIIMYTVENPVQPDKFPNIIASFWWSVVTLTTVGYGDVYPVTPVGKFFASIISLIGVGAIAIPTGIFAAEFSAAMEKQYVTPEETEPIDINELSEDEKKIVMAYRNAEDAAREISLETLINHVKESK